MKNVTKVPYFSSRESERERGRERERERAREREGEREGERILHGRAEITNFSSSEKYFTSERSELVKYFFNTNTNEKPIHYTLIVFGVKGAIYYVAIAKVSHM